MGEIEEIKPGAGFPKHLLAIWKETLPTVSDRITSAGLEALCGQIYRLREAEKRITDEGLVVQDSKGSPVPHPAISIERSAQAEIRKWIQSFDDY